MRALESRTAGHGVMAAALALLLVIGGAGCENPLDVENPNNLVDEDVNQPSAVPALVSGAQGTLARGVSAVSGPYSTASDELVWIGSRDAWNQLNQGGFDDRTNEFADQAFPVFAEARFMVDKAIAAADSFDAAGDLDDRVHLARAYLYGGILYTYLGDVYDDYAFPESPTESAPAVGADNMLQVYDQALTYLDNALSVARDIGDSDLELRILAQRARTHHARAVWQKLNPPGTPSDPLVDNQAANDDALAVLGEIGTTTDWIYQFTYSSETQGTVWFGTSASAQVNQRGELQVGPDYVERSEDDPTDVTGINLMDPIDDIVSPAFETRLNAFLREDQFSPFVVVSARELHLILAEAGLARADTAMFTTHVNHVRSMDDLTEYSDQVDPTELLKHERRANLFLQLRRLSDMYRFGTASGAWLPNSAAASSPGTFFPISITECRANTELDCG